MDVRFGRIGCWFRDRFWAFAVLASILCFWAGDDLAVALTPLTQQAVQAPTSGPPTSGPPTSGPNGEKPIASPGRRRDSMPEETQQQLPANLSVPSVDGILDPIPENPDIEARIRKALSNLELGAPTGDPILDGILEAVGRQGSVVNDSMLEGLLPKKTTWVPGVAEGNPLDAEFHPQHPEDRANAEDQLCRVAEQLLATARLLAQIPGDPSGQRRRLVGEMRREAASLLGTLQPRHGMNEPHRHPGFVEPPQAFPSAESSEENVDPFSR